MLYDILIVIGYNDDPVIKNKGSAIFLHLEQKNINTTEGCIAIKKKYMINLLKYNPQEIKIYWLNYNYYLFLKKTTKLVTISSLIKLKFFSRADFCATSVA